METGPATINNINGYKFRVCYKDHRGNKHVSNNSAGFLLTLNGHVLQDYGSIGENPYWQPFNFNPEPPIVQQWTGQIDGDGKEIYVGDILKVETPTYLCLMPEKGIFEVYQDWNGIFMIRGIPEKSNKDYVVLSKRGGEIKIIGNSYLNPELLK